ncbi:16S rRNA (adenine(1518)-N(6)/adenine(1519)-N(6))-dimethyltransferase RsmA [Paenibacillus yanchengensis]|uniref:Ribosomal RNA small subunit methyltransferase A n=1 Tax=Paenibacillus yanchengensis TaxID=2035833 RepID=A0ABW4YJ22_9BACL
MSKENSGLNINKNIQTSVATPARTKDIIAKHHFTFKKSLGQNFLIDQNVLQKIVNAAELDNEQAVLEIGPGIGALTERLAAVASAVTAVEIDQRLIPILQEQFSNDEHVSIVHGDILKLDLPTFFEQQFASYETVNVVANLPYYVTTPILMNLLEANLPLHHIVIMIQKEVAQRMAAKPGGKDYGSLSVAVQYYCTTELVGIVPNTVFIPKPNVDSAVIKLTKRTEPAVSVEDELHFFKTVQTSFSQRRKTLANNLIAMAGKDNKQAMLEMLESIGIDAGRRGETLTLHEFALISDSFLKVGWV